VFETPPRSPPERVACWVLQEPGRARVRRRNPRRYGAIVALSGALLGPEGTPRDYPGSLTQTPLFLGSGDVDPHLPKRRVDETAAVFERLGARVTRRAYPGLGHAMNEDEMAVTRGMLETM
jgi:predicted esterase